MRLMIFLLISILLLAPSAAWEIRGNIYPVENGIITWTEESFAGFNLSGSESFSLNISNEQIKAGHGSYKSDVQQKGFAHREWGHYSALSFLGQEFLPKSEFNKIKQSLVNTCSDKNQKVNYVTQIGRAHV